MYVEKQILKKGNRSISKKNHNIRDNIFDFRGNYINLHQNQQKRYEIQD